MNKLIQPIAFIWKPLSLMVAVVICLSAGCGTSHAAASITIPLTAKLTDAQGRVVDSSVTLTFRLYSQPTGGTAVWSEVQTNVAVSKGIVSVNLGEQQDLSAVYADNLWVGITVAGSSEMTPRIKLPTYVASRFGADAPLPSGAVIMWYGSVAGIPRGWVLCDGSNGTPDLRDRFVVGSSTEIGGKPGTQITGPGPVQSGGTTNHFHSGITQPWISTDTTYENGSGQRFPKVVGHTHSFNTDTTNHIPPFFALAFIMTQ